MYAKDNRQHYTEAEADVVDEARHFPDVVKNVGLCITEIPAAAEESGKDEYGENGA